MGEIEPDLLVRAVQARFLARKSENQFPRGMLSDEDAGELGLAVGTYQGTVIIAFHEPAAWIGMPPGMARDLAESLVDHANRAEATDGKN
jgi:hypothetical protein